MTKLFKRIMAYTIDIIVIMIITQALSSIPAINKQLDTYNKYYNQYIEELESYSNFKVDFINAFEDEDLTEKEYNNLIDKYETYQELLADNYSDNKLTTKEYTKINNTIDEDYQEKYNEVYYKIEQNSIAYFIICLITILLYFVGFNMLTGGQTLGKKLTRLKIVSIKDNEPNVSIWNYLIRAIFLYQPVYYLIKIIGISTLNMNRYLQLTTIFSQIQSCLEMIIIVMIMIRLDGRGLHDIFAKTKVIAYDRNGNEIEDPYISLLNKKREAQKNKKIIDEPTEHK